MRSTGEVNDPLLSISEVAARSGVASSALRFYESRGLIRSKREGKKHRYYPRSTLRIVAFIVFAQRIGYSLDEIAGQLSSLPVDTLPTSRDWQRLSRDWKQRVAAQIRELERLHMDLDHCIGCGCLSLKRCKMINPGDCAAESGTGPRRWLGQYGDKLGMTGE
jgi:MerR family transcriptional regulator, redox-sensitive transcriptional activator SoxR